LLYQNLDAQWNPKSLMDLNGPAAGSDKIAPLVAKVRDTLQPSQGVIHWTSDSADAEVFHAVPLLGPNQSGATRQLLGVLLVGSSRRPLIELQRRIVSTAMLVGGAGIFVAVLASLWFTARVTRPVESLAEAARRVAAGDLNSQSHDGGSGASKGAHSASRTRGCMARAGTPFGSRVEEPAVSLAGHSRKPAARKTKIARDV
jgi:methyl-accepting chemotaxis protein